MTFMLLFFYLIFLDFHVLLFCIWPAIHSRNTAPVFYPFFCWFSTTMVILPPPLATSTHTPSLFLLAIINIAFTNLYNLNPYYFFSVNEAWLQHSSAKSSSYFTRVAFFSGQEMPCFSYFKIIIIVIIL